MKHHRPRKQRRRQARARSRQKPTREYFLPADAKPTHRVHDVYCPEFLNLPAVPEVHPRVSLLGGCPSAQDED